MSICKRMLARCFSPAALLIVLALSLPAWAGGNNFGGSAVGGVMIDADGVLRNADVEATGQLRDLRKDTMVQVPGDLNEAVPLRVVSLRNLHETIASRVRRAEVPYVTDDMQLLAGLTRIKYVFVYPERQDIVLAGPAEGWMVDDRGNVIGTKTGQPILRLANLLTALQTAKSAAKNPISCSIDPTEEGVKRFQQFMSTQKQFNEQTLTGIEQALGPQMITVTGVPATSEFARVLVAADYRMKRLAMGFDKSPVKNMKSYLEMISTGSSAMPRWWLAPNYDALLKDEDGLAWELRGQGVKAMTEDSLFEANGKRKQTGQSSVIAQRWADSMTANFDELCVKEPVFGDLRSLMDLAIVAALIEKENLAEKAGLQMPIFLSGKDLSFGELPAPKQVDSQANAIKRGSNWIISASGGVEINSWQVADRTEVSGKLLPLHARHKPVDASKWWWN